MIKARNQNLQGTSFKLTHKKLKLTPCKLVRDGDSENKCIVICLQTTNEPRRKSKRKCTNPPLNVNDDGT
jgi:hypothetical protein